jgi:hypothetical protein
VAAHDCSHTVTIVSRAYNAPADRVAEQATLEPQKIRAYTLGAAENPRVYPGIEEFSAPPWRGSKSGCTWTEAFASTGVAAQIAVAPPVKFRAL